MTTGLVITGEAGELGATRVEAAPNPGKPDIQKVQKRIKELYSDEQKRVEFGVGKDEDGTPVAFIAKGLLLGMAKQGIFEQKDLDEDFGIALSFLGNDIQRARDLRKKMAEDGTQISLDAALTIGIEGSDTQSPSKNPYLSEYREKLKKDKEAKTGEKQSDLDGNILVAKDQAITKLSDTAEKFLPRMKELLTEQLQDDLGFQQKIRGKNTQQIQQIAEEHVNEQIAIWEKNFTDIDYRSAEEILEMNNDMLELMDADKAAISPQDEAEADKRGRAAIFKSKKQKLTSSIKRWTINAVADNYVNSDLMKILSLIIEKQVSGGYNHSRFNPEKKETGQTRLSEREFRMFMKETADSDPKKLLEVYGRFFKMLRKQLDIGDGTRKIQIDGPVDWNDEKFTPESVAARAKILSDMLSANNDPGKSELLTFAFHNIGRQAAGGDTILNKFEQKFRGSQQYVDYEIINFFILMGRHPEQMYSLMTQS